MVLSSLYDAQTLVDISLDDQWNLRWTNYFHKISIVDVFMFISDGAVIDQGWSIWCFFIVKNKQFFMQKNMFFMFFTVFFS